MQEKSKKKLQVQGFTENDIDKIPKIGFLARWTPFSCAFLGFGGLAAGNIIPVFLSICPCAFFGLFAMWTGLTWFFIPLGILTLTGSYTNRSIYDRIYNIFFKKTFRTLSIPQHGNPRKFGCTIGGVMYILSGYGFFLGNFWFAYIPSLFMITFAFIAGISQWCFASSIYSFITKYLQKIKNYFY